jgi:hypothetical protein
MFEAIGWRAERARMLRAKSRMLFDIMKELGMRAVRLRLELSGAVRRLPVDWKLLANSASLADICAAVGTSRL